MFGGHGRGFAREKEKASDTAGTLRRLFQYFQPYIGLLAIVGLLLVLTSVFEVLGPHLIGVAVDHFIVPRGGRRPFWLDWIASQGTAQMAGLSRVMVLLLATRNETGRIRLAQRWFPD